MRIAILATPRSGNTWLRTVLATLYDLEEMSAHTPEEIPGGLPARVVLQIHWRRTDEFRDYLDRNGFRLVVLARHPLDVLLSMLHFVRREPQTARWLDGAGAIPEAMAGASPGSPVFQAFAVSAGAANLLGVSADWWREPGCVQVRYEDLLSRPEDAFGALIDRLGPTPGTLAAALERGRFDVWRALPNRHGWQGKAGLHRLLIPALLAQRIRWRHRHVFATLGYRRSRIWLTARQAERNWAELVVD